MDDEDVPELQEPVKPGYSPLSPGDGDRKRLDKLQRKLEERRDLRADDIAAENLRHEIEAENKRLLEEVFEDDIDVDNPPESYTRFARLSTNANLVFAVENSIRPDEEMGEEEMAEETFREIVDFIADYEHEAEPYLGRLFWALEDEGRRQYVLGALREARERTEKPQSVLQVIVQRWLK